jgi:hypothetical protein
MEDRWPEGRYTRREIMNLRFLNMFGGIFLAFVSSSALAQQQPPYFGYFANAEYVAENYDHTNIEHIWASVPDRGQALNLILTGLASAKAHGIKAVISVDPFLFANVGSSNYGFEASASVYWQGLVDQLVSQGYLVPGNPAQSTVVAFYPVDEPDLRGLGDVGGLPSPALTNAINVIHGNASTAGFPIMVITSKQYPNMLMGLHLYDWVGMDNYHLDDSDYRSAVMQMESYLDLSRQHVVLVPQAFLKDGYGDANSPNFVYNMALSDPHVIMLMPFLWKHADFIGTSQVPALKEAYTTIGRQVKLGLYAQFVSQSVPSQMNSGQIYTVSVTYKNVGKGTWNSAGAFNLGSQNPRDNSTWGITRVHVPSSIAPGQIATFTFNVKAPANLGFNNFEWQLVDDNVTWFGPLTPNVRVNVVTPPSGYLSASPDPCTIYSGMTSCTVTLSWNSNRADAEVWVYNADGSGGQLFARAQSGMQAATWITTQQVQFRLRSGSDVISTANVYGVTSTSLPPGDGDLCPLFTTKKLAHPNLRDCP